MSTPTNVLDAPEIDADEIEQLAHDYTYGDTDEEKLAALAKLVAFPSEAIPMVRARAKTIRALAFPEGQRVFDADEFNNLLQIALDEKDQTQWNARAEALRGERKKSEASTSAGGSIGTRVETATDEKVVTADEEEEEKDEKKAEAPPEREQTPEEELNAAMAWVKRMDLLIVPRNIVSRPASIRGIVTQNLRAAGNPDYPTVISLLAQFFEEAAQQAQKAAELAKEAKRRGMEVAIEDLRPTKEFDRLILELYRAGSKLGLAF